MTENACDRDLAAAVLAWHGTVHGAHAMLVQATNALGDDPAWLAADTTLSALGRLQAAFESQLPSAGQGSPGSSPDPAAAPVAP